MAARSSSLDLSSHGLASRRRFARDPELECREQHQIERQTDERRPLLLVEGKRLSHQQ